MATLSTGALTTQRELAQFAAISEKDVVEHLEHLARSLPADGLYLEIASASCIACNYVFADRTKMNVPSQCPSCTSERIAPPKFSLRKGAVKNAAPRRKHYDNEDES
jgi:predicted Zn-ribbon and HTH transcriptional regulator